MTGGRGSLPAVPSAGLGGAARSHTGSAAESAQEPSTATRQRDKDRRLAERGDRILDALAVLIARWGYGKTTVDDIAREAGVAKGTVYLHWPTKGAMLHALLEREEQQWNALILARMAADQGDGTLSSVYRHALILCAENPLLRALFIQDHDALGEWTRSPQSRARSRRRMEALRGLLTSLRAAGLLRADLSVEVQAYVLAALLYGILTIGDYIPPDFVPPFAEVADGFAAIARRGFEIEPSGAVEEPGQVRDSAVTAVLMSSVGQAMIASSQPAHSDESTGPTRRFSEPDGAGHIAQSQYTGAKEVSA